MRIVEIPISHALSKDEWSVMSAFCTKVRRLIAPKLVAGEASSITAKFRYEQELGVWFEATLPPEEQVAEYLMAFRFFYLQDEPTNFYRVLRIMGKHAQQPEVQQALKLLRMRWHNALFQNAINLSLNDSPITTSRVLDLWFNAHYFHSDSIKTEALKELNEVFTEDFSKYMLLDSTYNASKVVFTIQQGLQGIVDAHEKDSL